jgi:deoxycytidine triphosphate deaminase
MKTLLVLVGLQGSGKTTSLRLVKNAKILRPSTSRDKRINETDEYYFENVWDESLLAWEISRGTVKYGLRISELQSIEEIGITVFAPDNIDVLHKKRSELGLEVLTVGLDTIASLTDQHARVSGDAARQIANVSDFDLQRQAVLDCDVVLSGDIQVVQGGLNALIRTLGGRGGFLDKNSILELIAAGTLLTNAQSSSVKAASYDLTLSDTYWCQGKYIILDAGDPLLKIPAYSFVLVQAKEDAKLPRFVAGSFDLKVSMFVNGLILSNGPQIDPGYSGALFCMLYNASDVPFALNRGTSFATLQFNTTSYVSGGYDGKYKNKTTFADFVLANTATSPGGKINEKVEGIDARVKQEVANLKDELLTEFKDFRSLVLTVAGLFLVILVLPIAYAFNSADRASAAADKASSAADKASSKADAAGVILDKFGKLSKRLPIKDGDNPDASAKKGGNPAGNVGSGG